MSLFDAPKIVRKVEAGPSSHKRTAVWSGTVLGVDASRMNRMRTGQVARAAHPNRTKDGSLRRPLRLSSSVPDLASPIRSTWRPEVLPWADVRLKNKFNPETTSSREWAPPATKLRAGERLPVPPRKGAVLHQQSSVDEIIFGRDMDYSVGVVADAEAAAAAAAAAVAAAGGADVARQTTGDPVLETRLRRLATRGVVTLFNAVHEAQRRPAEEADRKKATKRKREKAAAAADGADAPPLTKDSFLDILRRGSAAAAPAPAASALPGSRFLHDDFMMGRGRMRDFDHELDEDVEDGGGFGGGLDDVDD